MILPPVLGPDGVTGKSNYIQPVQFLSMAACMKNSDGKHLKNFIIVTSTLAAQACLIASPRPLALSKALHLPASQVLKAEAKASDSSFGFSMQILLEPRSGQHIEIFQNFTHVFISFFALLA
eukprot:g38558.t1